MPSDLFETGRKNRIAVLGEEYVRKNLDQADDFNRDFQRLMTEYNWGFNWSRKGLERKNRNLLNLGILALLNRPEEWEQHFRAGIKNGLTLAELEDALIQIGIYAGMPVAVGAFKIANKVLADLRGKGELPAA